MFTANIVPGQGFQQFEILTKGGNVTSSGRSWSSGYQPTGIMLFGMLVDANQHEKDQWKQNGHPISHKVIQFGAMPMAKATDYLQLEDGRKFYIQGRNNHADMNVAISYFVEERDDLK